MHYRTVVHLCTDAEDACTDAITREALSCVLCTDAITNPALSCVLSVSSYLMLSTIVWSYNGSRAPCMMLSPEPALPRAPACARAIDRVGLRVHPLARAGTRGQA